MSPLVASSHLVIRIFLMIPLCLEQAGRRGCCFGMQHRLHLEVEDTILIPTLP